MDLIPNRAAARALKGQGWAPRWWVVLLIGLALWIASAADVYFTGNLIVLPTVVLLGSFLVPVTGVVWYLDHDPSPALSPRRILAAFILAGVIGVVAASVVEFWVVFGPGPVGNLKVGLIEELVKGVAIVFVAWGIQSFSRRDGIVLGAAVGFGFAALESSGYALASLLVVQGGHLSLSRSPRSLSPSWFEACWPHSVTVSGRRSSVECSSTQRAMVDCARAGVCLSLISECRRCTPPSTPSAASPGTSSSRSSGCCR